MLSTDAKFEAISFTLRNVQAFIQSLESQVGQLANANAKRPQGSLLSNIKVNLREQLKTITLGSGREVEVWKEKSLSTEKRETFARDATSEVDVKIEKSNSKGQEVQRLIHHWCRNINPKSRTQRD